MLGVASTTRFCKTKFTELATSARKFIDKEYNPFVRPCRTEGDFGIFSVDVVDNEAARIRQTNYPKFEEYTGYYQVASHIYDATIQLAKIMHSDLLH